MDVYLKIRFPGLKYGHIWPLLVTLTQLGYKKNIRICSEHINAFDELAIVHHWGPLRLLCRTTAINGTKRLVVFSANVSVSLL